MSSAVRHTRSSTSTLPVGCSTNDHVLAADLQRRGGPATAATAGSDAASGPCTCTTSRGYVAPEHGDLHEVSVAPTTGVTHWSHAIRRRRPPRRRRPADHAPPSRGASSAGWSLIALLISVATFATGWWVFDGRHRPGSSSAAPLCLVPVVAATLGLAVRPRRSPLRAPPRRRHRHVPAARRRRPRRAHRLRHRSADRDVGAAASAGSRPTSARRKVDLPALWVGVRAITVVPALAAIAVLGMLMVGALGTILLIGGLIG